MMPMATSTHKSDFIYQINIPSKREYQWTFIVLIYDYCPIIVSMHMMVPPIVETNLHLNDDFNTFCIYTNIFNV